MAPRELESKYAPHVIRRSGICVLPVHLALTLLDEAQTCGVRLRGVEAFRLFEDGRVQPAMDFSNVSYGTVEGSGVSTEFKPNLGLRYSWRNDPDVVASTQALMREGAEAGYAWFEVLLEDPDDGHFFFTDAT